MKKFAIILVSILIAGLFVACNQDVTVDAQVYANMEVGTFVLNGQNYSTLQEAVNAKLGKSAKALRDNDGVIYLTRNASGPGAVIDKLVDGGVIIDFAGYTYSFTNVTGLQGGDNPKAETFGLGITGGADVTLRGLQQIDLNDTTTNNLTMVYVEGATTSLTIEDAPKMVVEPTQYVFWAANGATLTIGTSGDTDSASITGKIAATGTTTAKPSVTIQGASQVSGAIESSSAKVELNSSEKQSVAITADSTSTVNLLGKEIELDGYDVEEGATVDVGGGAIITYSDYDTQIKYEESEKTTYYAKIGDDFYATFADAINAAQTEDTIVLLGNAVFNNVSEAENIYYDLNSFVFSDCLGNTYNGNLYSVGKYAGGAGVDVSPYLISNKNDLIMLSSKVHAGNTYAGKYFALTANIDMDGVLWGAEKGADTIYCIGLKDGPYFSGNFDGKSYSIINLSNGDQPTSDTYVAPTSGTVGKIFGLFGYVSGNVTIQNLNLHVNADIPDGKGCGGLIANVVAGSTLNITKVTVLGDFYARNEKAAGFIGTTNGTSSIILTDCINGVNVTTKERAAGFISQIASTDTVTFINCHNEGDITLTKTNDVFDATEYGVAAGFISHGNLGTINYDDKCNNTGTITAPLAANYHTYAGALLYKNNSWEAKSGFTSAITVRGHKGVIISESSEAYARVAEEHLKAPKAFDGVYYNSGNTYGVIFNHNSLSSNSDGADSKYATYDELANYYKYNWNSGNTFTLQSDQTCSKTINVAGGGWTYHADLNGYALTTTVSILNNINANYSGTSYYTMTIKNGTITIDSSSAITSLFGATNSEYLVLTNVTIVNSTDHAVNVNGTSVGAGETVVIGAAN